MTKKELLEKITFDSVRPFVVQPTVGTQIPKKDIDYVTGVVIHRVRKMIRAAGRVSRTK